MLTPDSIVPDPANPQSFNRYSYVLNSPLNFTDPSGHRSCSAEQAASGDETCNQNIILPDLDKNYEYWEARATALQYYWDKFSTPFTGEQRLTSSFSPSHPTGVDWGGDITVLAPAPGSVTRAGLDTPAGMWQIQNVETGEIRTWGAGVLRESDRGLDGLLEPERLLATGQWEDIQPDWSHVRGTVINIDHGHNLQTRYHHLDIEESITVGTVVDQGDMLAVTANNGWSTGVHLHYGLWFEYMGQGEWLNPIKPRANSGSFQ